MTEDGTIFIHVHISVFCFCLVYRLWCW